MKFACSMASPWIGGTALLFYHGEMMWGYLLGSGMIAAATSVAWFDYCVPSFFYNLFKKPDYSKVPAKDLLASHSGWAQAI